MIKHMGLVASRLDQGSGCMFYIVRAVMKDVKYKTPSVILVKRGTEPNKHDTDQVRCIEDSWADVVMLKLIFGHFA